MHTDTHQQEILHGPDINPARLPEILQGLIETARTGHVEYPDRAFDWRDIERSLAKGDYDIAENRLNGLCERQDNLRRSGA